MNLRLGVRVRMRVAGRIVRRVTLDRLRVARGLLLVTIANRGNVSIPLGRQLTATLLRGRQRLARLHPRSQRALPPGTRTVVRLRYRGRAHGLVSVIVRVELGAGARAVERRYRIRL